MRQYFQTCFRSLQVELYFYIVCICDCFVTENLVFREAFRFKLSFLRVYFVYLKNMQHRVEALVFNIVLCGSHPTAVDYFGMSPIYFTSRRIGYLGCSEAEYQSV